MAMYRILCGMIKTSAVVEVLIRLTMGFIDLSLIIFNSYSYNAHWKACK